jgi:hypothetical protein
MSSRLLSAEQKEMFIFLLFSNCVICEPRSGEFARDDSAVLGSVLSQIKIAFLKEKLISACE